MAEIAGLKLIVPSSVAGSGVSVSASGKVTFTAATSISVNGVFDSTYDNYLVVVKHTDSSAGGGYQSRMRASGTDATGSNYTAQELRVDGASVTGGRATSTAAQVSVTGTSVNGFHLYLYGPALAQPTAYRSLTVSTYNTAFIYDFAVTHSVSTAYDGITLYRGSGSTSGSLTIYGFSQ